MEPNQLIMKCIKGTMSSRTKHKSRRKGVDEKCPREKTTTHVLMGFVTCYQAVRIISQGIDNYNRELRPKTEALELGWIQHCRLL